MFTTKINWKSEIPVLQELGKMGYTQTALAKKYNVSRQRIKQVVDKYIPDWNTNYGHAINRRIEAAQYEKKWGIKQETELYKTQRLKFSAKKYNAQQQGWTWDLSFGDIEWPTHCPILGIELNYFSEVRAEDSPSFDQIVPAKGYIKGNVIIMSWRANRIKNDGSAQEHRKIAEFLDKINTSSIVL